MKKFVLWTAGGLGLATVCGMMGLPHLSASIVTLTVFCSIQAVLASLTFSFVWALPGRIAAWANVSETKSLGRASE